MKKILGMILSFVLLASASAPALAQSKRSRYDGRAAQQRRYDNQRRAYYDYERRDDDRSVWEKHRDKITVAGGTAAGAVLGGVTGGKKGALIGAIVGAAGSALYTYKVRDRDDDRRYRY